MAPRVLFTTHSSRLAGAEFVLLDVVAGFEQGGDVMLFEQGPLRDHLRERGMRVKIARFGQSFSYVKRDRTLLRAIPGLAGMMAMVGEMALAARRHDVVYANSQKSFVLASLAVALTRRTLVWHLHDILTTRHFGRMQIRLAVWLANHCAALVIVPSVAVGDAFIDAGGSHRLLRVVPNGIPSSFGQEDVRDRAALRKRLGLPEGFLFGVFSRLAPWKGQDVAIRALASTPGAQCIIVGGALFGEDAYARSLRDLAAQLGVADRVLFLGHRHDVAALMRATDALVHPSVEAEPFGRTLVEAMVLGIPVIASNAGAASEILDGGAAGTLVPPGDAAALAAALQRLRQDPHAADAMTRLANARAVSLFDVHRMRLGVASAIHDAMARSTGRRSRASGPIFGVMRGAPN